MRLEQRDIEIRKLTLLMRHSVMTLENYLISVAQSCLRKTERVYDTPNAKTHVLLSSCVNTLTCQTQSPPSPLQVLSISNHQHPSTSAHLHTVQLAHLHRHSTNNNTIPPLLHLSVVCLRSTSVSLALLRVPVPVSRPCFPCSCPTVRVFFVCLCAGYPRSAVPKWTTAIQALSTSGRSPTGCAAGLSPTRRRRPQEPKQEDKDKDNSKRQRNMIDPQTPFSATFWEHAMDPADIGMLHASMRCAGRWLLRFRLPLSRYLARASS